MKTIVLSIDALISSDVEIMKGLDEFKPIFDHCVVVKDMQAIYPTLTYPCHVSIITGCNPMKHGVIHNEVLEPEKGNPEWTWYYNHIKCKTLFEYFKENGLTTAAVMWPVTADAPVDYQIPEIWTNPQDSIDIVKKTSSHNLDDIIDNNSEYLNYDVKRMQDTFTTNCTADIIERYNPDVVFLHFCIMDQMRHIYGVNHEKVTEALKICGKWFQSIAETVEGRNGSKEEITYILLGDHGHLNCTHYLAMNTVFAEKGWRAYSHGAGISAHVYVQDGTLHSDMESLFDELKQKGLLLEWYSRRQVQEYGLDGAFDYVLEASDGYYITSDKLENFITPMRISPGAQACGQHGHFPLRGDMPPLIVHSNRIKGRYEYKNKNLIDIAPTICKICGIKYAQMDGTPIAEIAEHFCK